MNNVAGYVQSNNGSPKVSVSITTPGMGQFSMPRVQNSGLVLDNGCYPSAYYINTFATPVIMRLNQAALANQMSNINRINEQNSSKSEEKSVKPEVKEVESEVKEEVKSQIASAQTSPVQAEVKIPKELVDAMEKIAKNTSKKESAKMELTDSYVKNLEKYLNSTDKNLRVLAGQDMIERLQEDAERRTNPALTALTNKMLQDPEMDVRCLSLGALNANLIEGDELTVKLLQEIAKVPNSQEANYANKVLLRY